MRWNILDQSTGRGLGASTSRRSPGTAVICLGALVVLLTLAALAGCGGSGADRPAEHGLRDALVHYEALRDLLAADRMDGLPATAETLATALLTSRDGAAAENTAVLAGLETAAASARDLARATGVEHARKLFSPLTRDLVALIQAHPRLREDLHIFECPMVTGFNKWIQPTAELENPYMGTRMLKCGSEVSWTSVPVALPVSTGSGTGSPTPDGARSGALSAGGGPAPDPSASGGADDIAYHTCPMHPSIKQPDMGTCPLCGMDLVPVTRLEVETGVVIVDGARQQQIGVRLARVETRPFATAVRSVGRVVFDETRLEDVTLRVGGWIGDLHADATGMRVRKGRPLFTLYSPELFAAQEEYLAALVSRRAAQETGAPDRADYLVKAARRRLALWDLSANQIDEIAERGEPFEYVPILSPVSGYVVEKNVVAGAAVKPGERLFRIAGLDRVWIEAELYESQLSLAKEGLPVVVTLSYLPGVRAEGRVTFVYPYLDPEHRTGRVRIELDNPKLDLKPDMYANVEFRVEESPRLAVPESAVLYAGARRAVFVSLDGDRFEPRIIETGVRDGDRVEVLSGLTEGDWVVSSGNFLIAAESRLKTSMERWR